MESERLEVRDRRIRLAELTREEIRVRAPGCLLVVPTAATEQHGPHLPVGTDWMVVEEVAARGAERAARRGARVLLAPVLAYGSSHHHLPYPGTLSLTARTFLDAVEDLARSAVRWRVGTVLFVNGHGGNDSLVAQAVRDLTLEPDLTIAAVSYWVLAWERLQADQAVRALNSPVPGHAGGFETSVMLHLRPELVDAGRIPAPRSAPVRSAPEGAGPLVQRSGWMQAIDGFSDASPAASAEVGGRILALAAEALGDLILRLDAEGR
jgi:creatinine amidohydrolase